MAMFLSYTADASQAPTPALGTKSITQNGTYNASDDGLDGYSEVTVNVSGSSGGNLIDCGEITILDDNGTNVDISNYTDQYANLRADDNFLILYDQINAGEGTTYSQIYYGPTFDFNSYIKQEKTVTPQQYITKSYNRSTGILNIKTTGIISLDTNDGVKQIKQYMSPVHLYIYIPNSNS